MAILDTLRKCNAHLQKTAQTGPQMLSPEEVEVLAEIENTIAHLKQSVAVLQQKKEGEIAALVEEGIARFYLPFTSHRQRSIQSNLTNIFRDELSGTSGKIAGQLLALAFEEPDLVMVWATTMLSASWTHNSMALEKFNSVIARLRSWGHPPWEEWMLKILEVLSTDTLRDSKPFSTFHSRYTIFLTYISD